MRTVIYHYWRNKTGQIFAKREREAHPVATVALVLGSDGCWHRGVAVCNPKDAFSYSYGRNRAVGLATKAMADQAYSGPMVVRHQHKIPVCAFFYNVPQFLSPKERIFYASQYNVDFTPHELNLIERADEIEAKNGIGVNA